MISGEITEYVGVDRIVAKRLRVPLQTDPAEPTVDVQSFRPLSVAVSPAKSAKCPTKADVNALESYWSLCRSRKLFVRPLRRLLNKRTALYYEHDC